MSILPKKNSYVEASKKDYKFLNTTVRGEKVVRVFQDYTGYLHVIVKNSRGGFNIYHSYDPVQGYHTSGSYDYDTLDNAVYALNKSNPGLTEFDPNSEVDVKFEYDAKFNFNCVGSDYLKHHDHRMPGFDTYAHTDKDEFYRKNEDGTWRIVPVSREEFDEHKRAYRIDNGQQRSMNRRPSARSRGYRR